MSIQAIIRKAFYLEQWNIGTASEPPNGFLSAPCLEVTWWPKLSRSEFQADPFFWGDKVIYERINRWRGRGEIWISDIDGTNARRFIRSNGHLSYPGVISIKGNDFLVCETSDAGKCRILEIKNWETKEIAVINEPIVDPTLLYHENRFWLFGTLANNEPNSKLFIWWSNSINGPWSPHPGNPVKTDKRSSRPAGNFIYSGGNLIRPAQDSRTSYGDAVVLCQVTRLSLEGYSETIVKSILPGEDNSGIHTLNIQQGKLVVDGKKRIFHPLAWLFKIRNKLLGLKGG